MCLVSEWRGSFFVHYAAASFATPPEGSGMLLLLESAVPAQSLPCLHPAGGITGKERFRRLQLSLYCPVVCLPSRFLSLTLASGHLSFSLLPDSLAPCPFPTQPQKGPRADPAPGSGSSPSASVGGPTRLFGLTLHCNVSCCVL